MSDITRRRFVHSAGIALTAAQAGRIMGANDRIHVAVVGLGGRGNNHVDEYSKITTCTIAALCDVNQAALERAQAKVLKNTGQTPKGYPDMKEVFADKNVDAVSMPLPNHWHALATIWACQAGKDVYIEKPACHEVWEGDRMIEAARKYNRIVQVGSQGRSEPMKQRAVQLLREGIIGKVYMVKGLCYKRRMSIGHKPDGPVPAGVDWDKFLGPAPMRPFNPNRFTYTWHWFWDTGNGDIGNQGVHQMDLARWALNKSEWPRSVVSSGGKFVYDDDQETPNTQLATLDYGDSQIVFEVRGFPSPGEGGISGSTMIPVFAYGSDGWMEFDDKVLRVWKGDKNEKGEVAAADKKVIDETGSMPTGPHMENFLKAVRSRNIKDLNADVAEGVASADLVHLSNISYRLGRKLAIDPAKKQFVNDAEANRMLTRIYRAPYVVPAKV
jgi:predicted dehydrogenase